MRALRRAAIVCARCSNHPADQPRRVFEPNHQTPSSRRRFCSSLTGAANQPGARLCSGASGRFCRARRRAMATRRRWWSASGALTYAELDVCRTGSPMALRARGGDRRPGHPLRPECAEWVVGYHALAKLGGVINPINVMLTPEEVVFVTRDCERQRDPDRSRETARRSSTWPGIRLSARWSVWEREAGRRAGLRDAARRRLGRLPSPGGIARRGRDHRLHLGHHRPSEGRDAESPCGAAQRALTATMHVRRADTRRDRAACPARLRQRRDQRRVPGRHDGGPAGALRRSETSPGDQRHRATMLEGVPTMYSICSTDPGSTVPTSRR